MCANTGIGISLTDPHDRIWAADLQPPFQMAVLTQGGITRNCQTTDARLSYANGNEKAPSSSPPRHSRGQFNASQQTTFLIVPDGGRPSEVVESELHLRRVITLVLRGQHAHLEDNPTKPV